MVLVLVCCLVQTLLPGFTADRPRGMNLVYREAGDGDTAHLLLESIGNSPDRAFAKLGGFKKMPLDSLQGGEHTAFARELPPLGLGNVVLTESPGREDNGQWRHQIELQPPQGHFRLALLVPGDAGLLQVYLDGQLALDTSLGSKHKFPVHSIVLTNTGIRPLQLELVRDNNEPVQIKLGQLVRPAGTTPIVLCRKLAR